MEVCNSKGGRTAAPTFPAMLLLMMMIMMLLNAYCCGAAVLAKSNTSFRCSDGRLDECLTEEDLELEFLINPYVSRILARHGKPQAKPDDPNHPAIPCGKDLDPRPYFECIKKAPKTHKSCGCIGKTKYCRC